MTCTSTANPRSGVTLRCDRSEHLLGDAWHYDMHQDAEWRYAPEGTDDEILVNYRTVGAS